LTIYANLRTGYAIVYDPSEYDLSDSELEKYNYAINEYDEINGVDSVYSLAPIFG